MKSSHIYWYSYFGLGQFEVLGTAIEQRLQIYLQREQVGGLSFACTQSCLQRFPLQFNLGVLLVDHIRHAFGKVALHPQQRDIALQRGLC